MGLRFRFQGLGFRVSSKAHLSRFLMKALHAERGALVIRSLPRIRVACIKVEEA